MDINNVTGLEMSKIYADNTSVAKTYDAYNRLATETDARGNVKTHSYEHARGLHLGTTYTVVDDTAATANRSFTYNHLGLPIQVTDDAGVRTIGYNTYGEQETDFLLAGDVTHLITETRDGMGRSTGFTYAKNGTVQHTVTTGYGTDGRIVTAGFVHEGANKLFNYGYLPGSNLLHTLAMPNGVTLTQTYETQRDLLTGMTYATATETLARRTYTYDKLGRPLTRRTDRNEQTVNDSFMHNTRSELVRATVNDETYGYDYDNIGNRRMTMEASDYTLYEANELNQYTSIQENEDAAFAPTFDADGNQTLVKTGTGIWSIVYNAENRPVSFTRTGEDGATVIECSYDSMGRRAFKKVTTNGSVTLHQCYFYHGYLQIAACDLTSEGTPNLWHLLWDPTQPVATRPLAIQKDGVWYTYGWDLTKNICEVFGLNGYINTTYTYTPYGEVASSGSTAQPIQWSSEVWDVELDLTYYNYRHYNPLLGRWISADPIGADGGSFNLYKYINNSFFNIDILGLKYTEEKLCLYPTGGKFGTVHARYNVIKKQIEVETEKWIMPSWYNVLTSPENTGERGWRAATDEELRIYFTVDDENNLSVERGSNVLFARAFKEVSNRLKIKEQMIAGNIILDLATIPLSGPSSSIKNAPKLYHYTTKYCKCLIESQGLLKGQSGIFATTKGMAYSSIKRTLFVGISSKRTYSIPIPIDGYKYFHKVQPIGPYSLLKYLGNVHYTYPGNMNILTGIFTQTGLPINSWKIVYGPDILFHVMIGIIYHCSKENN